jgi:serine phosphatase RsbU (regulator of sigma subunit)
MILTTTALIVVIVVLFGVIHGLSAARLYDEQEQRLGHTFDRLIRERGEVQSRDLAQASRAAILQSDFTTLQALLPEMARGDKQVRFVLVADRDGTILAHTDRAENGKKVTDPVLKKLVDAAGPESGRGAILGQELYAFSHPIAHDGQKVASVALAFTLDVLAEQVQRIKQDRRKAERASLQGTVIAGLFFVLLGTLLAIFQGRQISKPIVLLSWRADQIARGDLETRVETTSGDEIGKLADNFNYMADRLVVLLRETAEKATLEKELEVARAIQETLVPPPDLVDRRTIKLAGYFQPASQCGGDWWTVHDVSPDKLLVLIGDVTGHGVPAAMITAAAKAACDTIRAVAGAKLTVTYLLEQLNHAIYESAKRKFVMTCFASIVDTKARTITHANAGHNFPYVYRPTAGSTADGGGGQDFQVLMSRGNRLGDVAESTYTEKTDALQPGDTLVWYTDGIVECENDRGEEYGEKRFRAAIRRAASLQPADMREAVVASAANFFGDRPRKDDITLVFGRVY